MHVVTGGLVHQYICCLDSLPQEVHSQKYIQDHTPNVRFCHYRRLYTLPHMNANIDDLSPVLSIGHQRAPSIPNLKIEVDPHIVGKTPQEENRSIDSQLLTSLYIFSCLTSLRFVLAGPHADPGHQVQPALCIRTRRASRHATKNQYVLRHDFWRSLAKNGLN